MNNDFIFCSGLFQGKRNANSGKSLEPSKFSPISSWAVSAKPGLPAGQGAQEPPPRLSPSGVIACCPSEGHRGHGDHCQALLNGQESPGRLLCLGPEGEGESLSPPCPLLPFSLSWILNLLGFQLLYHLICF